MFSPVVPGPDRMSLRLQALDLLQILEAERRQWPAVIFLIVMPVACDA
jgi:hypothetical protein